MSWNVQASQVSDITSKWELAQRMSGHAKAPEQALKSIFKGTMQKLEEVAKTTFEVSMKERVWSAVSNEKLKTLKETFILEFCDKILGSFNEEQASEMLEEHKRTGAVKNIIYSSQLQTAFALTQKSIIETVIAKANSMTEAWIPEIVEAVKKEGVELPEPKSMKTAIHSHQLIVKESPIATKPKAPPFEVLINAVKAGDLSKVREALQKGVNPNGSVGVQNIIHFACEKGNIDIVRELLDNGAELNSRSSKWNDTPLHRACVFGHTEIVEELIKRGSTVNVRNSNCWETPLENAITFKHFECCKLLVKAGAKINELNRNYGSTPLKEACHTGCYEIVELLLDAEANPNLSARTTPLYEAVHFPKILQLLLDRGAKPNAQNSSGSHCQARQYPIHAAAAWGYDDSVCILLKAGADPKVQDGQNETPIEIAKWHLNNHQTEPCNPEEVTAQLIQGLEKVIGLLEGKMQ